jgi:hypothetical protein
VHPKYFVFGSVAEPHHFFAAPALGKNFDAAPAPTLLYSKEKHFFMNYETIFFI